MKVVRALLICCGLVFVSIQNEVAQASVIDFTSSAKTKNHIVIDVRANELCEKASLSGARCLPANSFLTRSEELANFSGILWLLGTIGLTGKEHVLVVGDSREDNEFVAGVLYLAGQHRISILLPAISSLKTMNLQPGESRSKTRENVFQSLMRDQALILAGELAQMISEDKPLAIFDIRIKAKRQETKSEAQIAGSWPLPIDRQKFVAMTRGKDAIVYGRKSKDGIAALARLESANMQVKALLGGWASWKKSENTRMSDSSFKKMVLAFLSLLTIFAAFMFFFRLQTQAKR